MPRSGRKLSPHQQHTEDAKIARRYRQHWERDLQKDNQRIQAAERRGDHAEATRLRVARESTLRAIFRNKVKEQDATRRASSARDAGGRRPTGGGGSILFGDRGQPKPGRKPWW